jgi:hypothetical protein
MIEPREIHPATVDRYRDTMRPGASDITAADVVQAIQDAADGPGEWDDEAPTTMPCPACARCRACGGSGRVLPQYHRSPTP